jgi:hypothetical protein
LRLACKPWIVLSRETGPCLALVEQAGRCNTF